MQALGKRVILELDEVKTEHTRASGIVELQPDETRVATVVSVGQEVEGIAVGDRVMWARGARMATITVEGKNFYIFEATSIVCVVEP